jgi:hypothetical protein
MTRLRMLASRLLALFRKKELREEFDQELRGHLEMETEQNLRCGISRSRRAPESSCGRP